MPTLHTALGEVQRRMKNMSAIVEKYKKDLAALKERLGAHFEDRSRLSLPLQHGAAEFGTYTDTRFFFRTRREAGLLFYLGNEAKTNTRSQDFVAVEIDQSRPRLIASLGSDIMELVLEDRVSDNQWRQLMVERVGRKVDFRITKPNSKEIALNRTQEFGGAKGVLNLYEDSRHLHVGGVPENFQLPDAIHERSFVGDVDELRVNGEPYGLWNSDNASGITGVEMQGLQDDDRTEKSVLSLNGKGYAQIGITSWNPRTRTTLLLFLHDLRARRPLDLDQLVIQLDGGRLTLLFDCGSGLGKVVSKKDTYNDGKWHLVHIDRTARQATMIIDNDAADTVSGESPGTMFEMSVSDSFFLGGLPSNIETRFAVTPFRGCLANLKLDSEYVDLRHPKSSKNVQNTCPNREIRVASLVSERSYAQWNTSASNLRERIQIALRFRTQASNAHIASLVANNEDLIQITLEDDQVVVRANGGGDEERMAVPLVTPIGGRWHYVEVERKGAKLNVNVDDGNPKSAEISSDLIDVLPADDLVLKLGKTAGGSFVGCIGDVIVNERLITFGAFDVNEVQLTGCASPESPEKEADGEQPDEEEPEEGVKSTPKPVEAQKSKVRPSGACALPLEPHGEREDARGLRFGLTAGSRVEFAKLPPSIGTNLVMTLSLRSNSANGIILFITNKDQKGSRRSLHPRRQGLLVLVLQSTASILDDEWHSIRAEREGASASLFVDNEQVGNDRVDAAAHVGLESPIYFGGVAKELHSFTARLLPANAASRPEFGGCLRDLKLNDESYEATEEEKKNGVVDCSTLTEEGVFFAKDGGYAMIPEFHADKQFHFDLAIKPRVKNAVLFSVGGVDFVTLQLVNGTVKLTIDDGGGSDSLLYTPLQGTTICDGNWHRIKATRKKNIATLNVDGKSNLKILKKKNNLESALNDPLYFGGVPRDRRQSGLDTDDSYVGCMRIHSASADPKRKRRDIDLEGLKFFGTVNKEICPLN
ncbi:Laminin-like protein epi-1 [Aphelenchoides fujianensis]|nr:Laminin-like protein epi-1 [Aphelenchoides fujianensis]